nr:thiol reductant ABC exporter subunit CydC [Xanthomonadaceae bacterium]
MKALLAELWPLLRRQRRRLGLALLLALVTLLASIGLLGVSGWFITATALVAGALATFNLFAPSALVRGLAFVRILARYGERVAGHAATLGLLSDLRVRVFGRLLREDAARLARWRDGDLVARLAGDVDALDSVFLLSLQPLLVGGLAGAAVVGLLAWAVPAAAWGVGVAWVLLLAAVPAWLARRARAAGQARRLHLAGLRQQVLQAVDGHADLLALGAAARAQADFQAGCAALGGTALAEGRAFALGQALAHAGAGMAMLVVAAAGIGPLREGRIGGAVLVGCVLAVAALFEAAVPVMRGAARLGNTAAAAARLREIGRGPARVADPEAPRPLPAQGEVEFRSVRFRHDPRLPLLEGIDLRIRPGERVVVTGPSGSGKSTLLALLLRLRDPDAGTVTWAGVDLRQARQAELHRRIALLAQDSPVFMGSVRDNLRIGDPGADDAALWEALQAVGLAGEVRALPAGLDEWLGEGGRTLSAGQARRLCLARVLLSGAPLLVLDEPTEGLDPQAAQAFLAELPRILQGRSLLLVTHARVPPGLAHACWRLEGGRLRPA